MTTRRPVSTKGAESAQKALRWQGLLSMAPQLQIDFHGNGDGGKTSQNDPLKLGPRSFGSKLMDHNGLKVSNFQLKI